jgi:hypothetical protein
MFQLHDQTRRQLCLWGFFLFCLLPTAIVLGFGIAWHLPGHVRGEAERLSDALGLKVSLERLVHVQPGVVRYEGLQLTDAETQKVLLRCARVERRWQNVAVGQKTRPCLIFSATDAQLDAAGLKHAWRLMQDALGRRLGAEAVDVGLSADQLAFPCGPQPRALADVRLSISTTEEGAEAIATFRLDGAEASEPPSLRIVRQCRDSGGQKTAPATVAILQTGATPLPCSLFASIAPWVESLGSKSHFCGSFAMSETADGGLRGELIDVDFERLVERRFGHRLSGTARIKVENAEFQQGRLQQITGSISCASGSREIGRTLLDSLSQHLGLTRGPDVNPSRPALPYDQLGLWFSVDARGLELRGLIGSGVILADHYGPLLGQPEWQPQPLAALVRALVPPSDSQVPATRQADALLGSLPLPEAELPR